MVSNIRSGHLVGLVWLSPTMVVLSSSQCFATSFVSSVPNWRGCSLPTKTFGSIDKWPTPWHSGPWCMSLPTMSISSMSSALVRFSRSYHTNTSHSFYRGPTPVGASNPLRSGRRYHGPFHVIHDGLDVYNRSSQDTRPVFRSLLVHASSC